MSQANQRETAEKVSQSVHFAAEGGPKSKPLRNEKMYRIVLKHDNGVRRHYNNISWY